MLLSAYDPNHIHNYYTIYSDYVICSTYVA